MQVLQRSHLKGSLSFRSDSFHFLTLRFIKFMQVLVDWRVDWRLEIGDVSVGGWRTSDLWIVTKTKKRNPPPPLELHIKTGPCDEAKTFSKVRASQVSCLAPWVSVFPVTRSPRFFCRNSSLTCAQTLTCSLRWRPPYNKRVVWRCFKMCQCAPSCSWSLLCRSEQACVLFINSITKSSAVDSSSFISFILAFS